MPLPRKQIEANIKRRLTGEAPDREAGGRFSTSPTSLPAIEESALQSRLCAFLRYGLPGDAVLTAIPGGNRGVTTTPGYLSGAPDLLIVYRGIAHFLEVKAEGGRLSSAQRLVHALLSQAGGRVAVVRSEEDVRERCAAWGLPLRTTAQ